MHALGTGRAEVASTVSLRVSLAPLFLVLLLGCGTARGFDLTVGGVPVDDGDVTVSATLAPSGEETTIDLRVSDPGPPGVADAGVTYVFRVVLAPGSAAGDVLEAGGRATMTTDVSRGSTPTEFAFVPGSGSDERVLALFAWAECFCGSPGTFEETLSARVDIVEVTPTSLTFSIVADVDGRIPGRGFADEHQELRGTFTALRPTR